MKLEQKRDIAEFITRGLDDFQCMLQYAPMRGPNSLKDNEVFGRAEAIERIARTWTGARLKAKRDELLRSNARGDLEKYHTMTPEGGYGSSFEAYSWHHAEEQAVAAGYAVLDWTEGMDRKHILVIED